MGSVEENRERCVALAMEYYSLLLGVDKYKAPTPAEFINTCKKFEKYIFDWQQEALETLGKET